MQTSRVAQAALGIGLLASPLGMEAAQAEVITAVPAAVGDICGPVYDQSAVAVDTRLTTAIDELAHLPNGAQVDVRLVILNGARRNGIRTNDDNVRYGRSVHDRCPIRPDSVTITYAGFEPGEPRDNPESVGRLYVDRDGVMDSEVSADEFKDARQALIVALRDATTPTQADFADFLHLLAVHSQPAPAATVEVPPAQAPDQPVVTAPDQPGASIDIPWGTIGEGGGVVAVLTAAGFGVASRRRYVMTKGGLQSVEADATATLRHLNTAREGEGLIRGLTTAEDPGLRDLDAEAADLTNLAVRIEAVRSGATETVPGRPWWADRSMLDSLRRELDAITAELPTEIAEFVAELRRVDADIASLGDNITTADGAITLLADLQKKLIDDEWDLGELPATLAAFRDQLASVQRESETEPIDESRNAQALTASVQACLASIRLAQKRHESFAELMLERAQHETAASRCEYTGKELMQSLRAAYAESDYADMELVQRRILSIHGELRDLQQGADVAMHKKSIASQDVVVAANAKIAQLAAEAAQNLEVITARQAELVELSQALPGAADSLQADIVGDIAAAEAWGEDIDPGTLRALKELREPSGELASRTRDRSNGLRRMDDERQKLADRASEVADRARRQHSEAEGYRSRIATLHATAVRELATYNGYRSQYGHVLHGGSRVGGVGRLETTGNRSVLHGRVSDLEATLRDIRTAQSQAESAVSAWRRAQAAAAATQQASLQSPGISFSPGPGARSGEDSGEV